MRLGIDLDGVVCDWISRVCLEYGVQNHPVSHWDSIFKVTNTTPGELFAHCKSNHTFLNSLPHDGAINSLNVLYGWGDDVQFITNRPAWASVETEAWLYRYLDWPDLLDRIHLVGDKSKVPCDLYLDDSPIVMDKLKKKSRFVVRFERPWNMDCKRFTETVADWDEFLILVDELTNGENNV